LEAPIRNRLGWRRAEGDTGCVADCVSFTGLLMIFASAALDFRRAFPRRAHIMEIT
jgi:hypothetical protein